MIERLRRSTIAIGTFAAVVAAALSTAPALASTTGTHSLRGSQSHSQRISQITPKVTCPIVSGYYKGYIAQGSNNCSFWSSLECPTFGAMSAPAGSRSSNGCAVRIWLYTQVSRGGNAL